MEINKLVVVDTDFLSLYLKGDMLTKQHVENMINSGYFFTTTSITSSEILFGAYRKNWKRSKINHIKDFLIQIGIIAYNFEHSKIYGKLRAKMIKNGTKIGFSDTAIASICLEEKIPLFTYNTKHFKLIDSLELF